MFSPKIDSSIIFAAVCCVLLLKLQGKLPQLKAAFCDKQVLKREIPAAVLLFLDWAIYLWAVQNGRVLECSLGYYIQPLVVFTFGAVISSPSKVMVPEVGISIWLRHRRNVDLPEPEGPITTTFSPG